MHQLHVNMISDIFHCLSKYAVVHELEEIFLKCILSLFPLLCIHRYVVTEPITLTEFYCPMNFGEFHAQSDVQLQSSVMDDVFFLIIKCSNEFG